MPEEQKNGFLITPPASAQALAGIVIACLLIILILFLKPDITQNIAGDKSPAIVGDGASVTYGTGDKE